MIGLRLPFLAAGLTLALLLAGCIHNLPTVSAPVASKNIDLDATPFFPQTHLHCGPAALATVLVQSGVETKVESLSDAMFVPGLDGSLREELLATVRQNDRIPVLLAPEPQVLVDTIASGKPVLLLQNLGFPKKPYWHYAVVIGFLPSTGEFILRSGKVRRQKMSLRRFLYAWDWGGRWAVAVLAPGESLQTVSRPNYLSSLVDVEQTGSAEFALAAFGGASTLYPDSDIVWTGYGHAAWRTGDLETARMAFEQLLLLDPESVTAHNNLANVYLSANCLGAAHQHAVLASDLVQGNGPFAETVADTLKEVSVRTDATQATCLFGNSDSRFPPPG